MGKLRVRKPRRRRIGRVSIYVHHGRWWAYYREHGQPMRRALADDEITAEQIAAQINLELVSAAPTLFAFRPVGVAELQTSFMDYHEHVVRSSLATVSRYRTATQHLVNFAQASRRDRLPAHEVDPESFVRYLRSLRVAPNGHPHAKRRPLRDKGIQYILQTCRSMYGYAAKRRHMPPYSENLFAELGGKRSRIEDAKKIFVFDAETELQFLRQASRWSFATHFLLAKTGLRVGELARLLIEDVDLDSGWLRVCHRPELGASNKTRRERAVPLVAEAALVLQTLIAGRAKGVVVLRETANAANLELAGLDSRGLAAAVEARAAITEATKESIDRAGVARICRKVWREAGATSGDRVRNTFIEVAGQCGLPHATCPKSWRHTFATLLQDANVDPLIRQLTLGHAPPSMFGGGVLGMTAHYTHTRPETQHQQISRALRLWPQSLDLARECFGDPS